MKKIFVALIFIIILISSLEQVAAEPGYDIVPKEYRYDLYKARVIEVNEITSISNDNKKQVIQVAKIEILNRKYEGKIAEIRNTLTGDQVYDITLKKGLRISVHAEECYDGNVSFYLVNYERTNYILQLIGIFFICLIIIGGLKGIKTIIALSTIILLIVYLLIPLLLSGYSPIIVSILVCALATLITLTLTAGFNKKSAAAILGTTGGLIIGGFMAYFYGLAAKLTGLSCADAQLLFYLPNEVTLDFRGLLFAGIIIGALGASMDVSISISSALAEIKNENPSISFKKLARSGLNIGKDIMGTMVNTLILAYTGGALTTLLIFVGFQKSLGEIINLDSVTTEIFRAITGSIGLIFAIPFTILAFGLIHGKLINKGSFKPNIKPFFIILFIFLSLGMVTQNANACPHFDEDGNMYFYFPDPEDFNIIVLLYLLEYHEHASYYTSNFEVIYEEFNIRLFSKDLYSNPEMGLEFKTVEGLDELTFERDNYVLKVAVKKAFKERLVTPDTYSLLYSLRVTEINELINEDKYNRVIGILNNYPVKYSGTPVLSFEAFEIEHTFNWTKETKILKKFIEPVTVTVNLNDFEISEENKNKITAVRLDQNLNLTEVSGFYDEAMNQFVFTTEETGTFVVVYKMGDLIPLNPIVNDFKDLMEYIPAIIIAVVFFIAAINFKRRKKF